MQNYRPRFIAYAIVLLWSAALINLRTSAQENDIYIGAVAWSPDGTMIAAVGTQGFTQVWDATTGERVADFAEITTTQHTIAWSPDNRRLATAGQDTIIRIWDVDSGQMLASLEGHNDTVLALAWSPNGQVLASGSTWDGAVILWDMSTYQSIRGQRVGDTYSLAWSPDGTQLAQGGLPGLRIFPADLELDSRLGQYSLFSEVQTGGIAWNSEGNRIAAAGNDGNLYIFDTSIRQRIADFPAHRDWAYSLAWSPDDRFIVSYGVDGQVKVWDASTTELMAIYIGNEGKATFALGFSPYGGRLAYGGSIPADTIAETAAQVEGIDAAQALANSGVQIVVPAPSLERLQAIAAACNAPTSVEQSLTASIQADQLTDFVAQVESLPEDTIPPACAADLIAVAQALQSR